MYEIRMITEDPSAYLPLAGLEAYPANGALYVMREQGEARCAAVVTLEDAACTLTALGKAPGVPEADADILLEWLYFKYGQRFPQLFAALPDGSGAFLAARGFARDDAGRWARPLTAGCCCEQ